MAGQEIASFYASIGADVKDFKKGLGDVKSDMSSLDKTSAALGTAFKAAFAVGVTALVAFTAVIGKSISAAADMEQGVADIGAMMSLTDADTQKLGDHIMDLGLDPKLKVSATEASGALMALGTAGLSVEEIMGGASKATVLLANATGLSGSAGLANAATIATDVMAQFNIEAADMNAAVSQITGTTVASKFSINDYQLAIAQAGGVASSVGVEFDDFNAIIAATSPSFASGSDAGTSFKTFLQRLVPDTEKAKIAMQELGLTTADGSSKFFDAAGNMKGAEEVAGLLQAAFSGLGDAQKISAASTIFGTDAMRTALSLAKGGTPIIKAMKTEIGNVDAENLAAKRMDTFRGAMEVAWGVIGTLSIGIGQKFLPVLRPMIETFTTIAQVVGPKLIDFFGKIATGMTNALNKFLGLDDKSKSLADSLTRVWENATRVYDAIVLAVAPVTNAIDKFLDWKDVLTAIALIIAPTVLSAIGAIVAAMWPVISTIALVTAAVSAMRWAWTNDFGGMQTDIRRILGNISRWFYEESGIWKGTWEDTLAYLKWWADSGWKLYVFFPIRSALIEIGWEFNEWKKKILLILRDWSLEAKHRVLSWVSSVKDDIGDFRNKTVNTFEHWKGEVIQKIEYFSGRADTIFTFWKNKVVRIAEDWRDDMLAKFQPVIDWFNENEWIQKGRQIVQSLWDGAKEIWRNFKSWWDDIWSKDVPKTVDVEMKMGSPSKLMEDYGKWTMQGFQIGAEKGLPGALGAMDGLAVGAIDAAGYGGSASSPDTALLQRNNQLLEILIAELRNKNMSVTVNGGGGGGSLSDSVRLSTGLRGAS